MPNSANELTARSVRRGIYLTGTLAVLIGAFWLAAWFTGYAAMLSLAGSITVKTNMALAQLLAGSALLLLGIPRQHDAARPLGTILAAVVFVIGALTLSEHIFGWDLGIDQLLATEPVGSAATVSPNRMGPPGSLCITLVGLGLLSLASGRRTVIPYLGLVVCIIALVPAIGFIYGAWTFYAKAHITGIAWPTVVALMSLGIGLIISRTDRGPMALLLSEDAGGRLLRGMLPWVILVPLVLGYFRVLGHSIGLQDVSTGTGTLIIALIITFSIMFWRSAQKLSRSDAEHREDEQSLMVERQLLQAVVNNIPAQINVIGGEDLRIELVNPAYQAIAPGKQMVGKTLDEVWPEAGRSFTDLCHQVLRTGKPYEAVDDPVDISTSSDGPREQRWFSWMLIPVDLPGKDRKGLLNMSLETTQRVRAEEALRMSEARLRRFYDSGLVGVMYWNLDGAIVDANDKFLDMLGYTRLDMTEGRIDWLNMTPPEYRRLDEESLEELKATGVNKVPFEKEYFHKDGTRVPIIIAGAMLDEERYHGVAFVMDNTERKRAEADKRSFYRRTILAATNGKLLVCEKQEIEKRLGPEIATWDITTNKEAATAASAIARMASEAGMEELRSFEFRGCVTEAVTNVLKHAGEGRVSLHRTADGFTCVVSDSGPGIGAMALPDLALTKGYSTAGTMGLGYKLIIEFADKVYLASDREGTTVAMDMAIEPLAATIAPSGFQAAHQ